MLMMFRGTDALQRTGIFYTLTSGHDHPVAKLMQAPMRARAGTVTSIGLSKSQVNERIFIALPGLRIFTFQVDRTALNRQFCSESNSSFSSEFGLSYSRLNCEIGVEQANFKTCSLKEFFQFDAGV